MSRRDIKLIAECARRGVESAFRKHLAWTGEWLDRGCEGLLVACVAEQLHKKLDDVQLRFEMPVDDVLREAGCDMRGRKARDARGRLDIVVLKGRKPFVGIEMKRSHRIGADVWRLRQLRRRRAIRHGLVAFYTDDWQRRTVKGRLDDLEDHYDVAVLEAVGPRSHQRENRERNEAWAAAVVMVL